MTIEVFLFGTLKQGFPNSHINLGLKLPGIFSTIKPYPLYLVGDRYSPWMVDDPGKGKIVSGEIYRLDKHQLKILDRLERIDQKNGYKRRKIPIINSETDQTHQAFCYLKTKQQLKSENIRLGLLSSYEPEHALLYRSRAD